MFHQTQYSELLLMAKLSEGRQRLLLMVTILLEGLQEQVLIRSMTRRCAKLQILINR